MKYLLSLTFTLGCLVSFAQTDAEKKEGLKKISPDREPTTVQFDHFNMPGIDINIPEIDINIDFDKQFQMSIEQFDLSMEQFEMGMEQLELSMEQLNINMEEFHFLFDMEEVEVNMEGFSEQMKERMKDMKKIKIHKIDED